MKKLGITIGDFNGISPEITIKALNSTDLPADKIVIFANSKLFDLYAEKFGLCLKKKFEVVEISFFEDDFAPGNESAASGKFSFLCLKKACEYANNGVLGAIATAPLSKNAMHLAGFDFSGQTEVLETFCAKKNRHTEMLFTAGAFRVLLLTRHIAISEISKSLSTDLTVRKIKVLNESLKRFYGVDAPKIGLCALNPHAGENGLFGDEEQMIFAPAVERLRASGIAVSEPIPADALFAKAAKSLLNGEKPQYDCYAAVYHDQGLIPVKMLCPKTAVNTTIGLDFIRTSPAHGTAFDIAGRLTADETGMVCAIKSALSTF